MIKYPIIELHNEVMSDYKRKRSQASSYSPNRRCTLSIQIVFKNVSRNFDPHKAALRKLIKVVETLYRNPVEFCFEISTNYKIESDGRIVPVSPVEVTVSENTPNSRRLSSRDYSVQADEVNQKIQDLLVFSKVEEFNLPSTVKISAGGRTYKFIGSEAAEEQEWR